MRVLIGLLFFPLMGLLVFIYEEYRYPACPKCGSNFCSKRIWGKIVCEEHGIVA